MAFDLGALVAAWHLAFRLRLAINPWLSLQFTHEQLTAVAPSLGGLLALWSATNLYLILSGSRRRESGTLNMFRLSESTLLVTLVAIPAIFFAEEMGAKVSRSFMLLFTPISYCMLIIARSAQHWLWLRVTEVMPAVVERVALIGVGEDVVEAADSIRKTEFGAAKIVGDRSAQRYEPGDVRRDRANARRNLGPRRIDQYPAPQPARGSERVPEPDGI